jgi:hypothetical protein
MCGLKLLVCQSGATAIIALSPVESGSRPLGLNGAQFFEIIGLLGAIPGFLLKNRYTGFFLEMGSENNPCRLTRTG